MSIGITEVGHVNVTVPPDLEQAAKRFYGDILGLPQVPKPEGPRQLIGAWYQIGNSQLHLSIEDDPQNSASDRHVCYLVEDLKVAADELRSAGFEVIPDSQPARKSSRFYVRDPAGNMLEISE